MCFVVIDAVRVCTEKQRKQQTHKELWCTFCLKNGERTEMVKSHNLRKPDSNLVECPILRAYTCETCHATGDYAHTRSYCPKLRMLEGKVCSATIALKSTLRQANGNLRNPTQKCNYQFIQCVCVF